MFRSDRPKQYPTFRLFLLGTALSMTAAPSAWAQSAGGQGGADPFTAAGLDPGQKPPAGTQDVKSAKDRAAEDLEKQQEKNNRVNNMMQNLRDGKYTRGAGQGGAGGGNGAPGTTRAAPGTAERSQARDVADYGSEEDAKEPASDGVFIRDRTSSAGTVVNGFNIDGFTDEPICVPDHTDEGEQRKIAELQRDLRDLAYTKAHDAEAGKDQEEELSEIYGNEAEEHAECSREVAAYARAKGRPIKSRMAKNAPDLKGMIKRGKTDGGAGDIKAFGPDIDLTNPVVAGYVEIIDEYFKAANQREEAIYDPRYPRDQVRDARYEEMVRELEAYEKAHADQMSASEFNKIYDQLSAEQKRVVDASRANRLEAAKGKGPLTDAERAQLDKYNQELKEKTARQQENKRAYEKDPSPENFELWNRGGSEMRELQDNAYFQELNARMGLYDKPAVKAPPKPTGSKSGPAAPTEAEKKLMEASNELVESSKNDRPGKPAPKVQTAPPATADPLPLPLPPQRKPPEVRNPSPTKRGSDG
ncbi:hypothetical protein P6144_18590 [Sphingomonas sp. HITSZ_GF]|uniref:hypothetical protein n=1 Tax=Sphingomonas sp. HITSZ_GF TaxID=3037247 RepID=UPI00240E95A3|nr:hypothetical protein [Sphingomonas sp. HITSZ_GF]MDG2535676.1 hypothetical protein [Sphingomonas sp. HITSZ_GF]